MGFNDLLRMMIEKDGSDLFLTTGAPPSMKAFGKLVPLIDKKLPEGMVKKIAYQIMNDEQIKEFEKSPEMNLAVADPEIGRFRVNIFQQRGEIGIVARNIKTEIPSAESLGLPPVLSELIMSKRGIILFVGGTGSGKSTSLAALIDYRNKNSDGHIITIEDPVEFVHPHQGCIVNQREVGVDTNSYEDALKNTLRQAPDVILIGEIRSQETMEHALAFAETGHLCLSTLHANNANQALDRIMHFFPAEQQRQLWMDLSLNLRAIVAQQLIPTPDGNGRRAVIEVLINTPLVSDHIRKGEVHLLKDLMSKSNEQGMQTFDQALFQLYSKGEITYEDALAHADSANDLRLMIKLDQETDANHLGNRAAQLSIQDNDSY